MAFEELRERLKNDFTTTMERLQENPQVQKLKEVYENQSPLAQKGIKTLGVLIVVYIFLSYPLGYRSTSKEYLEDFASTRSLIQDLLKVEKEKQSVPNLSRQVPPQAIQARIQEQIQRANLLPEQVAGVQLTSEKSSLVPAQLLGGVIQISLKKLNLQQAIDLGFSFQSANTTSSKLKDLVMTANSQDPKYYDVTYKVAVFQTRGGGFDTEDADSSAGDSQNANEGEN